MTLQVSTAPQQQYRIMIKGDMKDMRELHNALINKKRRSKYDNDLLAGLASQIEEIIPALAPVQANPLEIEGSES